MPTTNIEKVYFSIYAKKVDGFSKPVALCGDYTEVANAIQRWLTENPEYTRNDIQVDRFVTISSTWCLNEHLSYEQLTNELEDY